MKSANSLGKKMRSGIFFRAYWVLVFCVMGVYPWSCIIAEICCMNEFKNGVGGFATPPSLSSPCDGEVMSEDHLKLQTDCKAAENPSLLGAFC